MMYTVDRIEGGFAVLEDEQGGMTNVRMADLPEGTSEGDKLERTQTDWRLRPDLKAAAMEKNRQMLKWLQQKRP